MIRCFVRCLLLSAHLKLDHHQSPETREHNSCYAGSGQVRSFLFPLSSGYANTRGSETTMIQMALGDRSLGLQATIVPLSVARLGPLLAIRLHPDVFCISGSLPLPAQSIWTSSMLSRCTWLDCKSFCHGCGHRDPSGRSFTLQAVWVYSGVGRGNRSGPCGCAAIMSGPPSFAATRRPHIQPAPSVHPGPSMSIHVQPCTTLASPCWGSSRQLTPGRVGHITTPRDTYPRGDPHPLLPCLLPQGCTAGGVFTGCQALHSP